MEEKLKSVIRSPRFGLLFKTAIFFVLFQWARGGGMLASFVFIAVSIFLYARPTLNALTYIPSFVVLMALAFLFPTGGVERVVEVVGLAFAALFYILLRLKELLFIRRLWWHEAFVAGLSYLATLAYFISGLSEYFLFKYLGLGVVFFLLTYELFTAHSAAAMRTYQRVTALLGTLLFLELAWALALLPFGYAASAGIAAIFAFLFLHLSVISAIGHLKAATAAKHAGLAVSLAILIVLFSSWNV